MILDCQLNRSSCGTAFTVPYLSCYTFFVRIVDGIVMQWCPETTDWAAVLLAPHSQWHLFLVKISYDWLVDDAATAWGCLLDSGIRSDLDHAAKIWNYSGMNTSRDQGVKVKDPKNHMFGSERTCWEKVPRNQIKSEESLDSNKRPNRHTLAVDLLYLNIK